MGSTVHTDEQGGILGVVLDRPQRLNAVSAELVDDLVAALETARRPGVGAVVLSGRGRAFCAGHDLKEDLSHERPADTVQRLEHLQDVTRVIRGLDVPVVAAVHGHAIGAGAEIAFACDLVVAARGTGFRFPEVSLGLSVTNGATRLLNTLVGPLRAKQLVMLGEPFDSDAALGMGLVNAVVAHDELLPAAHTWAARLASQPPAAMALAKRALNEGLDGDLATALRLEATHALETSQPGERRGR